MILNSQDVKSTAQKHLANTHIKILDAESTSPQQYLVAQYNEISKAFETLDSQAFELGRDFLQDLLVQANNDITLKCLLLVNKSAFQELQPDECEFLEAHAEDQIRHGLNLHFTLIDAWECLGQDQRKQQALKKHLRTHQQLDYNDIAAILKTLDNPDAADEQMATQEIHRSHRVSQGIRAAE